MTEAVVRCRNCGVSFDAPEAPCPRPSPGRPLVDCGRGGHWFEELPAAEYGPAPVTLAARRDFADGSAVAQDPTSEQWWARTPRGWLCREEDGLVLRVLYATAGDAAGALHELGYAREGKHVG